VITFFKQLFTWWNKQTFGTFLYTLIFGRFVGRDEFENKYYKSRSGKRWVIYSSTVESSKIPPEWHLWIHFMNDKLPNKNLKKYEWQKKYEENLTGTKNAYKPEGSLSEKEKKILKKYETWEA